MQKVLIFALLLSGLFFSASSSSNEVCPPGSATDPVHGCVVPAPSKSGYKFTHEGVSSDVSETLENAFASFSSKFSNTNIENGKDGFCNYTTTSTRSAQLVSINQTTLQINYKRITTSSTSYSTSTNGITCPSPQPNTSTTDSVGWAEQTGTVFYCPPDPPFSDFLTQVKISGIEYCVKGNKPSTCPTAPDGNNYFHVGQKGGGKVCLENDQGDSCPYKEEGTSGFYTADYSDPTSCKNTPPEPPNDNKDCSPNGAGQMVCNADPDEKCQPKNGLLVCQDGCGFMNGVFKCFKEPPKPEEPEEPEQPEVPDPPIDDNITDPDKPLADMTKADLKSTYRGIETRLESTKKELEDSQKKNAENAKGIISAINNVGRKVDKTNENLESAFKGEKFDEKGLADEADIKAGLGITGSEKITDLKNGEISIDSFKSSFAPFLSSGQCPPPRSISVYGKSYQLDWDPFCQFFTALGYLVMATAYILVPFIVFGGKK